MQVAVASMVGAKEEFAVVTFNTDGLSAGQGLKMLDMEEFTRDLNNQGKVLVRKDAHWKLGPKGIAMLGAVYIPSHDVSAMDLKVGEGQQAQRVWRPAGKRDADACATSLELGGEKVRLSKAAAETHCRDGLRKVGDDDAARASLAATWGPLWGGAGGLYRVEKDPDFGSAFLKLRLFPHRSAAVFVMRHPFATALSYRKHCGVATKCVAVWLEVWTACLRALRRDPAPHAVVRYEDVVHHADAVVDAVVGVATGRRLDYRAASVPLYALAPAAPALASPLVSPSSSSSSICDRRKSTHWSVMIFPPGV